VLHLHFPPVLLLPLHSQRSNLLPARAHANTYIHTQPWWSQFWEGRVFEEGFPGENEEMSESYISVRSTSHMIVHGCYIAYCEVIVRFHISRRTTQLAQLTKSFFACRLQLCRRRANCRGHDLHWSTIVVACCCSLLTSSRRRCASAARSISRSRSIWHCASCSTICVCMTHQTDCVPCTCMQLCYVRVRAHVGSESVSHSCTRQHLSCKLDTRAL
jgi:hypothetical protein